MTNQDRRDVLLRAAYDLLKSSENDHCVREATHIPTQYDGTNCDGYCLMEDIRHALDLDEGTEPLPLKDEGEIS